jgi:hypothetical protein
MDVVPASGHSANHVVRVQLMNAGLKVRISPMASTLATRAMVVLHETQRLVQVEITPATSESFHKMNSTAQFPSDCAGESGPTSGRGVMTAVLWIRSLARQFLVDRMT